jgi:hypothetical protein
MGSVGIAIYAIANLVYRISNLLKLICTGLPLPGCRAMRYKAVRGFNIKGLQGCTRTNLTNCLQSMKTLRWR